MKMHPLRHVELLDYVHIYICIYIYLYIYIYILLSPSSLSLYDSFDSLYVFRRTVSLYLTICLTAHIYQ